MGLFRCYSCYDSDSWPSRSCSHGLAFLLYQLLLAVKPYVIALLVFVYAQVLSLLLLSLSPALLQGLASQKFEALRLKVAFNAWLVAPVLKLSQGLHRCI
eukprot:s2796_g10.t1